MKKIITRLFALFAFIFVLFGLASCASNYSTDSMKSGLKGAGYTVEENPTIQNLDTSKLTGYKSSIYAYKTVNGEEEGILILVFDSADNASKAGNPEGDVATEFISLMHNWGKNHAPSTDVSVYGTANNLVWAGASAAKQAAGIK